MSESQTIDISGALKRWWWVIVILLGVALAVTAFLTSRQIPIFESAALLAVAPSSEIREPSEVVRALDTLERRTVVATFARIPSNPGMRDSVAEEMGLAPKELRGYRIRGSVVPNTNILRVDVEGPDPERVAGTANAAARVTARDARSLYRVFSMRELATAVPARRPSYPDPQRNYLVGGAAGLVLGIAAALVLDRARRRPVPAGDR